MTGEWAKYLGIPWANGAQGPDAYDCWAFVRHIQLEHFGIRVPVIDVNAANLHAVMTAFSRHPELENWHEVSKPIDGDCVLMASGKYPYHVGVWVADGVLHCPESVAGVQHQTKRTLALAGWGKIRFYRHGPSRPLPQPV